MGKECAWMYCFNKTVNKLLKIIKSNLLIVCFAISILVNVFLIGYRLAYQPDCKREHIEEINRNYDCVPNEKIAKAFAGAAIGLEDNWETQEKFSYTAQCTYNSERYEWIVTFFPTTRENIIKIVGIRRDNHFITIYQ